MRVLGTKPASSTRAASVRNCRTSSPAPAVVYLTCSPRQRCSIQCGREANRGTPAWMLLLETQLPPSSYSYRGPCAQASLEAGSLFRSILSVGSLLSDELTVPPDGGFDGCLLVLGTPLPASQCRVPIIAASSASLSAALHSPLPCRAGLFISS